MSLHFRAQQHTTKHVGPSDSSKNKTFNAQMSAALLITWHFREHPWNYLSNSGIWRSKQTQRCVITDLINSSAWLEDGDGETSGRELLLSIDSQSVHRGSSEWVCVCVCGCERGRCTLMSTSVLGLKMFTPGINPVFRTFNRHYLFIQSSLIIVSVSQSVGSGTIITKGHAEWHTAYCIFIPLWQEASTFTCLGNSTWLMGKFAVFVKY